MDPEVIGDDGLYLGLGRSGEEQRGNGGKNCSAQRVSLSQKGDQQLFADRTTSCVGKYWRPYSPSNGTKPLSHNFTVTYYTSMRYTIYRIDALDLPNADWERPQWQAAETLEITHFSWEDSGHRPRTQARVLYDERALSIIFRVEDRYVRAVAERFQDSVCTDSCVEFFVAPLLDSQAYFNFEVNCGGTMLLHRCPSARRARPRSRDRKRQRRRRCHYPHRHNSPQDRRARAHHPHNLGGRVPRPLRPLRPVLRCPNARTRHPVEGQLLQVRRSHLPPPLGFVGTRGYARAQLSPARFLSAARICLAKRGTVGRQVGEAFQAQGANGPEPPVPNALGGTDPLPQQTDLDRLRPLIEHP